jgi:HEPN domain-containing protein
VKAGCLPSPEQREFAELLLRKAEGDAEVVRALIDNPAITDDAIGFHAQQAVEKALKAVLAFAGVRFPRTHDLGFLLELADAATLRVPDVVVEARWLTPWSAEFRYDDPPVPDALDRAAGLRSAELALSWARAALAGN